MPIYIRILVKEVSDCVLILSQHSLNKTAYIHNHLPRQISDLLFYSIPQCRIVEKIKNVKIGKPPTVLADLWCERGESNSHDCCHTPLKRACLPVPALSHFECFIIIAASCPFVNQFFRARAEESSFGQICRKRTPIFVQRQQRWEENRDFPLTAGASCAMIVTHNA